MESSNQGWPPRSPMELIKDLGILDTLSHKWPQPHELQGHPRDPSGTYIRLIGDYLVVIVICGNEASLLHRDR